MSEPFQWGVAEAADHIRARRISSREYVQALMMRISDHERSLRAWANVSGDLALEQASQCDEETARGVSRGPLHGVAIAIKDNFDVAGLPTRGGSDLTDDKQAAVDAAAVDRLRRAGAIVLGKTAMTPFAAMDPAETGNPWNLDHTPGGSSSGSAAAVGAQMCAAALGSQTAGSVLRPAAYCGVVGLKPTYDVVSRQGLMACAWSMDHVGVIARDVDDTALLFGILMSAGGAGKVDAGEAITVGIPDQSFDMADARDAATFQNAVGVLAKAGARIMPVKLPDGLQSLASAGILVMYAELAAFHRDLFSRRASEYPPRLRVLVEVGLSIGAADYVNAQRVRHAAAVELSAALAGVTIMLTPTTGTAAPSRSGSTGDWRFNLPFSASGHPAITLPCGFSKDGLPLGIQAVASHGREDRLFKVGRLFQQHSDWHRSRAPMMKIGLS